MRDGATYISELVCLIISLMHILYCIPDYIIIFHSQFQFNLNRFNCRHLFLLYAHKQNHTQLHRFYETATRVYD